MNNSLPAKFFLAKLDANRIASEVFYTGFHAGIYASKIFLDSLYSSYELTSFYFLYLDYISLLLLTFYLTPSPIYIYDFSYLMTIRCIFIFNVN